MRKDPLAVGLRNMKEHPQRWANVNKEITLRARLVRSQFRVSVSSEFLRGRKFINHFILNELRDTVFGNKRLSLEEAVKDLAQRYSLAGIGGITLYHDVRIGILVRFE